MLRSDPIFATLPPQSYLLEPIKSEPARWTQPAFQGGGWNGAGVTVIFHSNLPVAQVAHFYNRKARADGWRPGAVGGLGFPLSWSKDYSGGVPASLIFSYGLGVASSQTYGQGTYEIDGSIQAIIHK